MQPQRRGKPGGLDELQRSVVSGSSRDPPKGQAALQGLGNRRSIQLSYGTVSGTWFLEQAPRRMQRR
jgi:hypothetical protein